MFSWPHGSIGQYRDGFQMSILGVGNQSSLHPNRFVYCFSRLFDWLDRSHGYLHFTQKFTHIWYRCIDLWWPWLAEEFVSRRLAKKHPVILAEHACCRCAGRTIESRFGWVRINTDHDFDFQDTSDVGQFAAWQKKGASVNEKQKTLVFNGIGMVPFMSKNESMTSLSQCSVSVSQCLSRSWGSNLHRSWKEDWQLLRMMWISSSRLLRTKVGLRGPDSKAKEVVIVRLLLKTGFLSI